MKKFVLTEMLLLSLREKKARKLKFHPKTTIIVGGNGTGKSCLVKSIYNTFGAEPHKLHPNWVAAEPISLVKFSIDEVNYAILKAKGMYTLFNSEFKKIGKFSKLPDLTNALAPLLDFKIKLTDKSGNVVTPPLAYLFLPYYADQDKSWIDSWASFIKLGISNAQRDIVEYHTGIFPNEYYEKKNELAEVRKQLSLVVREISMMESLLKNINDTLSKVDFSLDMEYFQKELNILIEECSKLSRMQNQYKSAFAELNHKKISIQSQLSIVKRALIETKKQYALAVDDLGESVPCPSCGAEYENSFAERFSIAQDEERCYELKIELENDLSKTENQINDLTTKFLSNKNQLAQLENILEKKQANIKLRDIIESEGKRELKNVFQNEIKIKKEKQKNFLLSKYDLEKDLRVYNKEERAELIRQVYRGYMNDFLLKLNVTSLPFSSYQNIHSKLEESGSVMPRTLMAYYYSILHVISKYGSSAFCPIIIDSPNQQGQDRENLPNLIKFIINQQPTDSQLILALEEIPKEVSEDVYTIELTEKESLLQSDDYKEVYDTIRFLLA